MWWVPLQGVMVACEVIWSLEDFNTSRNIISLFINQSEGHTIPWNSKPATASKRCIREGHSVCECQEKRESVWLEKLNEDAHHQENKSFPPTPSGIRKVWVNSKIVSYAF